MRKAAARLGLALMLAGAAPGGRVALGQYGAWGAFVDPGEGRCFAIAEPASARGEGRALAIARWRRMAGPAQVHARLGRDARTATLRIGGTTFALRIEGRDAWARDAGDDRRIVQAIRAGSGGIAIEARGVDGGRWHDLYPLAGAPSAIDAMRVRCLSG